MGLGGISMWQLLIILLIVILIFGTKRLKGMGKDLGGAVKGFKDAMDEEKDNEKDSEKSIEQNGDALKTETKQKENSEK